MDQKTWQIFENINSRFDNTDEEFKRVASAINDIIAQQDLIDAQKRILAGFSKDNINYSKIVTLSSYAGIFGIWGFTKNILGDTATVWVGILLTISIILYVGHEVFGTVTNTRFDRKQSKLLLEWKSKDQQNKWVEIFDQLQDQKQLLANKSWPWFYYPSLITGFSAGAILLFVFIRELFRIYS